MHSRQELARDLRDLGLGPGDIVMVHASVRAVGARSPAGLTPSTSR